MRLIRRKISWRSILFRLAFYGGLYLAVCAYLAYTYIHPARQKVTAPTWVRQVDLPGSHASIPAWVSPRIAGGVGRPVVFVLAYGYGGTRESWSDLMLALPKMGFECVAPCMPGQEASRENSVGFGLTEAHTIVDTVRWVRTKYRTPPKIVLCGVSMGGAASWIASEQDPTVDAVVTEGAYARFDEAMNNWLNRKIPGSSVTLRPMIWFASAMDHLNPSDIVPLNSAAKWTKPALVIQGGDDVLIPMSHARQLSDAAHCRLWIVPGAQHAQCFTVARKAYLQALKAIADTVAPPAKLPANSKTHV
ncbi:MAG: alpha/beta fold hydrolase [Fimbriimonas sp.]|nr:alpha/beta fold hydrolase [Fimbriimonas sp.]